MKENIIQIIISLMLIPVASPAFALTAEEAIAKVTERITGAETMKGNLTVSFQTGENYSGTFMYMKPGKFYIKFTDPPGKLIITNGKKLWIYDQSTELCGIQELETEDLDRSDANVDERMEASLKPKLSGGILRFFSNYEVKINTAASQPVIELSNDSKKYSEIKLTLDSGFMITSVIFKDKDGDGFAVKLSDIKTGEKITPGIFNFKAPANAQVVKNPLDIR